MKCSVYLLVIEKLGQKYLDSVAHLHNMLYKESELLHTVSIV